MSPVCEQPYAPTIADIATLFEVSEPDWLHVEQASIPHPPVSVMVAAPDAMIELSFSLLAVPVVFIEDVLELMIEHLTGVELLDVLLIEQLLHPIKFRLVIAGVVGLEKWELTELSIKELETAPSE